MPPKKPQYMESIYGVKPGDILVFRPGKIDYVARGIMFMQSLVGQEHGHYDSTHAAVCVGTENGKPMIAHLTEGKDENGKRLLGWVKEPLEDMIARDGDDGDRPFIAYRPTNSKMAETIAQNANNESNKSIKWVLSKAASSFVKKASLDPKREMSNKTEYSQESFCSKFVMESIKISAVQQNSKEYYPNIRSTSTPKTVEAYLYKDDGYEMLVQPGKKNPYELLKAEINDQIKRIEVRKDPKSKAKCENLRKKMSELEQDFDNRDETPDNLQKAIELLKVTKDDLNSDTSYNLRSTTKSYREVMAKARNVGIYERDLQEENKKDLNSPSLN